MKEGNIERAQVFNKKGHNVDFGYRGFHTLKEIARADLSWVKGWGCGENFDELEEINGKLIDEMDVE